jgi:hypothetical protein
MPMPGATGMVARATNGSSCAASVRRLRLPSAIPYPAGGAATVAILAITDGGSYAPRYDVGSARGSRSRGSSFADPYGRDPYGFRR